MRDDKHSRARERRAKRGRRLTDCASASPTFLRRSWTGPLCEYAREPIGGPCHPRPQHANAPHANRTVTATPTNADPNASSRWVDSPLDCGDPAVPGNGSGCLFNVLADPTEHAQVVDRPDLVSEMRARIAEINLTVYSPDRGTDSGEACAAALGKWLGFYGPWLP